MVSIKSLIVLRSVLSLHFPKKAREKPTDEVLVPNLHHNKGYNSHLLYGSVSQGLGTTKFTNLEWDIDRGLDFPI